MLPHPILRHARRAAAAGAALLTACAGGARPSEGPFLAPGPLPGTHARDVRSSPALPAGMTIRTPTPTQGPAATGGLPPGLTAAHGTGLLPGAQVPGIGPVRALVVPVSLGPRLPARDDVALARDYFGTQSGGAGQTVLQQLSAISDGNFRPSFEILPTLVDSRPRVLPASPTPADLVGFARAVLQTWSARTDLTRFDDDGPDGIPASADDDGRLDFVVLVVETDTPFPSMTVRQDLAVQTPRGVVNVSALHVLSLSRAEDSDLRPAIGLALDALGLDPGERFFPPTHPRSVSSLARVRLGWLPARPVTSPGVAQVEEGAALLYPLQDLAAGAGFWLLERAGDALFVSRVARKPDGHFLVTDAHVLRPGQGQVLPLTRQFGERGPRVTLRWTSRDAAPEAELQQPAAPAGEPGALTRATP